MAETKHTPWKAGSVEGWNAEHEDGNCEAAGIVDAEGQIVGFTVNRLHDGRDCSAMRATILRAVNSHDDLVKALENIIPRFERSLIANGTDEEFAKSATEDARAALAKART